MIAGLSTGFQVFLNLFFNGYDNNWHTERMTNMLYINSLLAATNIRGKKTQMKMFIACIQMCLLHKETLL